MNTIKIGKFIAERRKMLGLTQMQLAEKLFITDKAVSKWERGLACPDISSLQPLSKILEVSVIELLNGEISEEIDNNLLIHDSIITYVDSTKKDYFKKFIIFILVIILSMTCAIYIYTVKTQAIQKERINDIYDSLEWAVTINLDNNLNSMDEFNDLVHYEEVLDSINYTKVAISQMRYTLSDEYLLVNNKNLNECLDNLSEELNIIKRLFYEGVTIHDSQIYLPKKYQNEIHKNLIDLNAEFDILTSILINQNLL